MKNYIAVFTREDNRWMIRVLGVRGCHTQATSIEQGKSLIIEALTLFDEGKFEVKVSLKLDNAARKALSALEKSKSAAAEKAKQAQQAQQTAARIVVEDLHLNMRDAGQLLGISHQRVHQLFRAP